MTSNRRSPILCSPDAAAGGSSALKIVILYKRNASEDAQVLAPLEKELSARGHQVFIDRHLEVGVEWAREIEKQIRTADAVIPLISEKSINSEMMGFEVEHAHEMASANHGSPQLFPVRVNYTGPLNEPMDGILEPIQYILWEGEFSNEGLIAELEYALGRIHRNAAAQTEAAIPSKGERLTPKLASRIGKIREEVEPIVQKIPTALESVGGAVPLDSPFYLVRPVDQELEKGIAQHDSIILIKGARQMGKTSLLARGMAVGRKQNSAVVFTDFQKLNNTNLVNANSLYLTLAESLCDQLDLDTLPSEIWDENRGANNNFERYLKRVVLKQINRPLIWAMDEVDRLFGTDFSSEVFGLFRSWHNDRAMDPEGPWSKLTLVIAYATEAHLFITDMNQSPFNVGTRLTVDDFNSMQLEEMNRRYKTPLKDSGEVGRLGKLVGGHPFLVRRSLHELATDDRLTLDELESSADLEEGIFGDHLRRILVLLARDPELEEVVKGVVNGRPCPNQESFYRLRSAGLIVGNTPSEVRIRCRLYATYLRRHLK